MAEKTPGDDAGFGSDPAANYTSPAGDTSTTGSAATRRENPPLATTTSEGSAASGPTKRNGASKARSRSRTVRSIIASVVWLIAVAAALILAVGSLLIALEANSDDAMVSRVLDAADRIDWFFWKVIEMGDRTKNHLVNWGLAAVSYLIAGRIADRIIRP